ncbi:hypothetical protein [Microbacterium invictum]|uniref:Uncharacterized protein n=1 Tax=Microbacterium invictum TaxID=515415 RepID=A0AA40SNA5_9MICO|nr:hypothetical protein [Microbacterium invictum]MBB4139393.1 hypothetical protein [Microbacterium invictum]
MSELKTVPTDAAVHEYLEAATMPSRRSRRRARGIRAFSRRPHA